MPNGTGSSPDYEPDEDYLSSEPDPEEDESFGSKTEIKDLYSITNPRHSSERRWSEYAEEADQDRVIKQQGASSAIIQRLERSHEGSWLTLSLEVQSSLLKAVLSKVLEEYPETILPKTGAAKFTPPFKPLYYRFGRIFALGKSEQNEKTRQQILLLINALKPTFGLLFDKAKKLRQTGMIAFDDLWMVFAPGDLVVREEGGICNVCRLHYIKNTMTPRGPAWQATLHTIEWSGRYFCVVESEAIITQADNNPCILETLPIVPLKMHQRAEDIRKRLSSRAKRYLELCTHHSQIKTYRGTKYVLDKTSRVRREKHLSGRVIVDPYAYFLCESNHTPSFPRLNGPDFDEFFSTRSKDFKADMDPAGSQVEQQLELQKVLSIEKRCLCLGHRVKGFDLQDNEWCEFDVESLDDCTWNDQALSRLVLPEGEKELLMAFTQRNELELPDFDDVIPDKGKGVIILLCGPPGVGKTLTAESVAERSHVPLYSLRASDLGTDPAHVESTLRNALTCCKLWKAVLLIDEADVFLESRSADRLEQNELVSIFLRNLEYYQGVMFLTTNRADSIDPAFRSRIDLTLPFFDLTVDSRRTIWKSFLTGLPSAKRSFSEADLDELATAEMNGREIKNAVKISRFVAASKKRPLQMDDVKTILDVNKRLRRS